MKTQNLILVIIVFLFAYVSSAQNNAIERSISKDVLKISNKSWLSKDHLVTVTSLGYPFCVISKKVVLVNNQFSVDSASGNIVSEGYPYWTISKGIQWLAKPTKPVKKESIRIKPELIAAL
jgi:hypothetical protein